MIQITPHMRILVSVEAVDFGKGIDGLARVCREVLATDGHVQVAWIVIDTCVHFVAPRPRHRRIPRAPLGVG